MIDTILTALSIITGIIAILMQLLYRETVGEIKRRLEQLERKDDVRGIELATLEERFKASTATLERIEKAMVPRAEWEMRHQSTDVMLHRIFEILNNRSAT